MRTRWIGGAQMKYCVGTCHMGTDMAVFIAGKDDEQLTYEESKQLASRHGKGYILFNCTADE